ncbi:MAG: 2-C-methyl-D-erythritol 4-phosphate cytidylyltransferase [Desulfobacterales bacterium]
MKTKVRAIIVAAGKGNRMSGSVRKQYIALDGIPILGRTLNIFDSCVKVNQIIVVVPDEDLDFCRKEILTPAKLQKDVNLIAGGSERQDSVYNALKIIEPDEGIVIVHDGVRPFVRQAHLVACIKGAAELGACILGIPAFDTVKKVNPNNEIIQTHQRDTLWLAQTPQVFEVNLIKKAHEKAKQEGFRGTDDASLVERLGAVVKIIPGSRRNIKITNPEDLNLARAIIKDWPNEAGKQY